MFEPAGAKGEQGEVLIETYWNVNLDYAMNCDIVYRY